MALDKEDKLIEDSIPGVQIWRDAGEKDDSVRFTAAEKEGERTVDEVLELAFKDESIGCDDGDPLEYYSMFYLSFMAALDEDPDERPLLKIARPFMKYVVEHYKKECHATMRLRDEGLVDGGKSYYLFPRGKPYAYYSPQHKCWQIGILRQIRVKTSMFGFKWMEYRFTSATYGLGRSDRASVTGAAVETVGLGEVDVGINFGMETVAVDQWHVRVPTEEEVTKLMARGKTYLDFVKSQTVAHYKGRFVELRDTSSATGHSGRVIVDAIALNEVDPKAAKNSFGAGAPAFIEKPWSHGAIIPPEACIFGSQLVFSLQTRQWGGVQIEHLEPASWRVDSINSLVLSPTRKSLLKAVVSHDRDIALRDFVDAKAASTLVLLEGPSGSGKSLSAQVVAEFLKRPLYVIDINSLDLDEIEHELRRILKLSKRWNAVVLIDEADALFRNRQRCDPEEARRVATFLRVLEEHEGIIFLTSNHLLDIDPALLSRVSLVFRYGDIGRSLRETIWANLLKGVPNVKDSSVVDCETLSRWPLNGREIKHSIKMGLILAKDMGTSLTTQIVEDVLIDSHGPLWKVRLRKVLRRLCFWK